MAVSKLADLVIVAAKYRNYRGAPHLYSAEISPQYSRLTVPGNIVGRDAIANAIRQGYQVVSLRGGVGPQAPGQTVHLVQNGMYWFLRVDNLPIMADDLGVVRRI